MNYNLVEFLTSYGTVPQLPKASTKPEIVFAGHSNVGKSSMMNKVFGRKALVKVSATPGKTCTINFFNSKYLHFVDLPGYGYAKRSKQEILRWAKLIEAYFHSDRDIRIVFSLIDIRHSPTGDDIDMINFLAMSELPFVVVLTKADKLSNRQLEDRLNSIRGELPFGDELHLILFSAKTGLGVEEVHKIIEEIELDAQQNTEK